MGGALRIVSLCSFDHVTKDVVDKLRSVCYAELGNSCQLELDKIWLQW